MSAWCPDGFVPFPDILRAIALHSNDWQLEKVRGGSADTILREGLFRDGALTPLGRGLLNIIAPLLVNDKLTAYGVDNYSGELLTIPAVQWRVAPPASDWHEQPASMVEWALTYGQMQLVLPTTGATRVRPVLSLRGLATALGAANPPDAPPTIPLGECGLPPQSIGDGELRAWMLGYLKGWKEAKGVVAKREAALAACVEANHCTTRSAEAAFEAAPFPDLRNAPPGLRGKT